MTHSLRFYATIVLILLLAAGLRFHGLATVSEMLHHDEAWNGWRAVQMLQQPQAVLYFPDNTGNESGWTYLLTLMVGILGASPFTLRLTAMFTGLVAVAAMYPLARQMLKPGAARLAMLALAVLYWHVHLSHVAFHGNLVPPVGMMALTALLRALHQPTMRRWLLAGFFNGLLAYTYTAGHGWTLYLLMCALLWLLWNHSQWRGVLLMTGLTLLLAVPVYLAILTMPAQDGGLSRTLVDETADIGRNVQYWLDAWLVAGDRTATHNLPFRPVLDVPLAILAVPGLVGLWWQIRHRLLILLLAGLFVVSLMPSLLTLEAPHFLRGIGAVSIVSLVIGSGAAALIQLNPKTSYRSLASIVVLLLFGWAAWNSYGAFRSWLATERFQLYIDDRISEGMAIIREQTPPEMPVYVPGLHFHPVASFRAAMTPPRDLRYFMYPDYGATCFITAQQPVVYLDLPIVLPHFRDRILSEDVTVLYEHPQNDYNVYQVTPDDPLMADWTDQAVAGDFMAFRLIPPLPETVRAGETLTLTLAMRVTGLMDRQYQLFVHLYGDPTPYEGGTMWAVSDAALCPMLFDPARLPDETLIQTITLTIPPQTPPGEYVIALGLYDLANPDVRPPLLTPAGETRFYAAHGLRVR